MNVIALAVVFSVGRFVEARQMMKTIRSFEDDGNGDEITFCLLKQERET